MEFTNVVNIKTTKTETSTIQVTQIPTLPYVSQKASQLAFRLGFASLCAYLYPIPCCEHARRHACVTRAPRLIYSCRYVPWF